MYDFSRKMFLLLYSTDWPNLIVRLPLLLEILGNICIAIVCICITIALSKVFKLTLSFESSRISTWPNCEDRNLNISRTKTVFKINEYTAYCNICGQRTIKKLFSMDYVNNYLFSIFFFSTFCRLKSVGLPKLLISWFINFKEKHKAIFIIFKGLSVAKGCLRPERAPLKKDPDTSVFLSVSSNFSWQPFYATPLDECFCMFLHVIAEYKNLTSKISNCTWLWFWNFFCVFIYS